MSATHRSRHDQPGVLSRARTWARARLKLLLVLGGAAGAIVACTTALERCSSCATKAAQATPWETKAHADEVLASSAKEQAAQDRRLDLLEQQTRYSTTLLYLHVVMPGVTAVQGLAPPPGGIDPSVAAGMGGLAGPDR